MKLEEHVVWNHHGDEWILKLIETLFRYTSIIYIADMAIYTDTYIYTIQYREKEGQPCLTPPCGVACRLGRIKSTEQSEHI